RSRCGYGCPLINEVHKMHPHMRRYSIQRILRETRAGVLEPGQALSLITRTL
ncbi:MAG TPA: ATPase, partial [Methanobacterium sp.]